MDVGEPAVAEQVEGPAAEHRALHGEDALDRAVAVVDVTWAVMVWGRFRTLTATASGTGARPGQYT